MTPEIQNLVEEFNKNHGKSSSTPVKSEKKISIGQSIPGFKNPQLLLMPDN